MATRRVALIGHPVAHSRSPAMMSAAFRALSLDAAYVPFDVAPERLGEALADLRTQGFLGANVTVPHKVAAMAFLDRIDPLATAVGAVNTLTLREDCLEGHNTDAHGVVAALRDAGSELAGARVVVIGTGGAARGAVAGLATAGASAVTVLGRRGSLARELSALADALSPGRSHAGYAMPSREAQRALSEAGVIVQATSCGMHGGPLAAELLTRIDLSACSAGAFALDLVYAPRETEFLKAAIGHGLRGVDGLGVLLHQGARAISLWFGVDGPIAAMRASLEY